MTFRNQSSGRVLLYLLAITGVAQAGADDAARKGEGSFAIDGVEGAFDVSGCVVVRQSGKGAKLQLIGNRDGRQFSVTSNGLTDNHRQVHQVSIRLDQEAPSYFSDYRLADDGWTKFDDQPARGPLIEFQPGRVTVAGDFKRFGAGGSQPAMSGRIEAECPTLTAAKIDALEGKRDGDELGEARGTATIDGRSGDFEPDCTMMEMAPGRYILSLRSEGDPVAAAANVTRFADDQAQQHVKLSVGDELWVATHVQEQGQWRHTDGEAAPGPLVSIDGKRISAEGEFRLHGSNDRRARGQFDAYCPDMTTLSGS